MSSLPLSSLSSLSASSPTPVLEVASSVPSAGAVPLTRPSTIDRVINFMSSLPIGPMILRPSEDSDEDVPSTSSSPRRPVLSDVPSSPAISHASDSLDFSSPLLGSLSSAQGIDASALRAEAQPPEAPPLDSATVHFSSYVLRLFHQDPPPAPPPSSPVAPLSPSRSIGDDLPVSSAADPAPIVGDGGGIGRRIMERLPTRVQNFLCDPNADWKLRGAGALASAAVILYSPPLALGMVAAGLAASSTTVASNTQALVARISASPGAVGQPSAGARSSEPPLLARPQLDILFSSATLRAAATAAPHTPVVPEREDPSSPLEVVSAAVPAASTPIVVEPSRPVRVTPPRPPSEAQEMSFALSCPPDLASSRAPGAERPPIPFTPCLPPYATISTYAPPPRLREREQTTFMKIFDAHFHVKAEDEWGTVARKVVAWLGVFASAGVLLFAIVAGSYGYDFWKRRGVERVSS